MGYFKIFGRGFLIVMLVAANTVQIARGDLEGGFVFGFLISFVWWHNSRTASRSDLPGAGFVYALGAGCGTVAGTLLGRIV